MTNESRNPKPNPFESLPGVALRRAPGAPAVTIYDADCRRPSARLPSAALPRYFIVVHGLDVATLPMPMPSDGTPAHLSLVMLGRSRARAMLVATAETGRGQS